MMLRVDQSRSRLDPPPFSGQKLACRGAHFRSPHQLVVEATRDQAVGIGAQFGENDGGVFVTSCALLDAQGIGS